MDVWSLSPELVWGLFKRGLGVLNLISFASLLTQVVETAGGRGVLGASRRLRTLRDDFPGPLRYLYFPTLLWANSSDAMLRALNWIGLVAAGVVVYGGPLATWALAVCYLCYLSLDFAIALIFPWDCLLFESTLLALFLPETLPLPALEAVSAPAPALTWAYRLLVFRVMFGFGKQKFLGSRNEDLAYLKGFLVNQPLLSPLGWFAQKAPLPWLKLSVLFMFLVEIPVPFFAFFPGWASIVCAVTTVALMLGIQAMGSFGYFSFMTICACIPLLDNVTPQTLVFSELFAAGAPVFTNAYVLIHTLGALVVLPFNSWIGQSWNLWAAWYQLPRWFQLPLGFFQWLHPFRWVHPYGVFPPNNQPGVKITLMLEVSWDRARWHEIEFVYSPSNARSAPRFIAPHHPRGDQAVIYDTFGLNPQSLVSAMLGPWDPNLYCARSAAVSFCQALLDGTAPPMYKPGPIAQHDTPPIAARLTTIMLEPVSLAEWRKTGNYWKRTYIGPHTPAREIDPQFSQDAFGEPELWHFEAIMWRRRSHLRPLIDAAQKPNVDPLQLVKLHSPLEDSHIQRFWDELQPLLGSDARNHLDNLPGVVEQVEQRFSRADRRLMYRTLNRFALILVSRLEPLYLHQGRNPQIPVRSYFHLWMLAHHIICTGKEAYLAAVAEPRSVTSYIPQLTNHTGLFALSVFRYQEVIFESQKLRLIECFTHPHDPARKRANVEMLRTENFSGLPKVERFFIETAQRVSGFFNVAPTLRECFRGPQFNRGYPELYPEFRELPSGVLEVARYGKVTSETPLASDLKSLPTATEARPLATGSERTRAAQ
ncbi:MAG: lipase maturation factor family protein [Polyangiales bacterium]